MFKTQATAGAQFVVVSRTNNADQNSIRFSKGSFDYAVGALGEIAVGKASEIAPPPPPVDSTPPSTPANLVSSNITETGFSVAWTASTDNVGVTGYELTLDGAAPVSESGLSHAFSGLHCASAYTVGVRAVDAAGNTSGFANLSVTTSVCPDTEAPTSPGNLAISNRQQESLDLSWTASSDNVGVDHYNVFVNNEFLAETEGTSFSFTGLTCGSNYTLEVQAEDAATNTSARVGSNSTTLSCGGPPPKQDLTLVDRTFVCDGLVNYGTVKVTISGNLGRTDAVRFAAGCTGRIDRLEVDTSNADGIHIGAFAHDLVVASGYVHSHGVCGDCGSVHIDGIQALGGQRITMTLDVDYPTATNSALYINTGSGGQDRPTDIVCDGCTFRRSPDKNRVVRIGNSLRSGIRNSTVYWCGTGPTCDAPQAPAIWGNGLATDPVGVTVDPVTGNFTGPTPDNTLILNS